MLKTLKEWQELATSEVDALVDGGDARKRFGVLNVFTRIWAGIAHGLQSYITWAMRQQFAHLADAEYLDAIGIEIGLPRIQSSYAVGGALVTGTAGTVVQVGQVFQRADGVQYEVTTGGTIDAGGTVSVSVICTTAGETGNYDAGGRLVSPTLVLGVDSAVSEGISGAVDTEDDDVYRERLLQRRRQIGGAGTVADWETWVKDYSTDITRVRIIRAVSGAGTVGVVAVLDNDGIVGSAGFYAGLQSYLEGVAPIGAVPVVLTPTIKTIDFEIALTPDTAAVRAAVEGQLADLIYEFGMPGDSITLSQIGAAISGASGEQDHTIIAPTTFVSMSDTGGVYEVGQLGVVT